VIWPIVWPIFLGKELAGSETPSHSFDAEARSAIRLALADLLADLRRFSELVERASR
jgi:hypothetical protein